MAERIYTLTESELRKVLAGTFDLFFEFRDQCEYEEDSAKWEAIDETMEGLYVQQEIVPALNEEARRSREASGHE